MQIDGEPIEKPHPLEWYPGRLAWQMNFSRSQARRVQGVTSSLFGGGLEPS